MKQLIEALQIFLKHGDEPYPFHCTHERLNIIGYDQKTFSEEEIQKLYQLGFHLGEEGFYSFKYGSA